MPHSIDEDFGRYRDYLIALARAHVSVDLRGAIDVSDLVQETLYDAVKKTPNGNPRTPPAMMGWLRSLLKCNLIDRFRRLKLERQIVSLDGSLDQTSEGMSRFPWPAQSGPVARLIRQEDAVVLADALGRLSAPQAEAIILKYCQGMSVAEIGRHMNRTPDAVGGLLRHGMRRLREVMAEKS